MLLYLTPFVFHTSNKYKEQLPADVSTSVMAVFMAVRVSNVLSCTFITTTNRTRCVEKSAAVSVVAVLSLICRTRVYKTLTDRREPT